MGQIQVVGLGQKATYKLQGNNEFPFIYESILAGSLFLWFLTPASA